jgi:hypothetical protein
VTAVIVAQRAPAVTARSARSTAVHRLGPAGTGLDWTPPNRYAPPAACAAWHEREGDAMEGTTTAERPAASAPVGLKLTTHLVVAAAIALIAPFTGLAWPFAILTGFVIGADRVDRDRGVRVPTATKLVRALGVTGGVLAMLFFGAVIGGLIAFLIAALAAFSEQAAGGASPTDRTVARLLVFVAATIGYIALGIVLGLRLDIRIGG